MKTAKLYMSNVYTKEFDAKVIAVNDNIIILDQTAFFPEGGGQSCDLGKINGFDVLNVYEDEEYIYHEIEEDHNLKEGTTVKGSIDWERRFDNMQRHCGEHILTGVIFREFGGENRGFHMGDEYMTIDILMEEGKELTKEMLSVAEMEANKIIWENIPMTKQHYDTLKEAEKQPVRKKVTVEKDITLVGIGSIEDGWGCCACCGTHPDYTGQVGLVKVFRFEHNKGMYRIYFEAGRKALEDYQNRFSIIEKLGQKYSAGTGDLIEKLEASENRNKTTRTKLFNLRQHLIEKTAKELQNEIADGQVHSYELEEFETDDIRNLAKKLDFSECRLAIFNDKKSLTALVFSNGKVDCGKLIKDNAEVFGGKGGGRADNAQAKFANEENMELFADAMEKILR